MSDECWRSPVSRQARQTALAALNLVLVKLFLPLGMAIPFMILLAAEGLALCSGRLTVRLDVAAGRVVVGTRLLALRLRLANITSVRLSGTRVTIDTDRGWGASVRFGGAGMVRAITTAAEQARAAAPAGPRAPAPILRQECRLLLLGGTGLFAIAAALSVRTSWSSPFITAAAAIFAVYLGIAGLVCTAVALWFLGRKVASRRTA
jgi:hypothetical protein